VDDMTGLEHCYQRNKNFVFRQIEDETILVPIRNNVGDMDCLYNLNEVGAYIWQQLDGQKSLADVKKMVVSEFDVPDSTAEKDLREFIADLKDIAAIIEV
jgi:methyltransferase-like protein